MALLGLCNSIMRGSDMPGSFAASLINPLRKKADSTDAMDYQPMSLLQAGYKIFAKVIAKRVTARLGTIIGETQQGFVRGRQLEKSVAMMMAMMSQATTT